MRFANIVLILLAFTLAGCLDSSSSGSDKNPSGYSLEDLAGIWTLETDDLDEPVLISRSGKNTLGVELSISGNTVTFEQPVYDEDTWEPTGATVTVTGQITSNLQIDFVLDAETTWTLKRTAEQLTAYTSGGKSLSYLAGSYRIDADYLFDNNYLEVGDYAPEGDAEIEADGFLTLTLDDDGWTCEIAMTLAKPYSALNEYSADLDAAATSECVDEDILFSDTYQVLGFHLVDDDDRLFLHLSGEEDDYWLILVKSER